MANDEAPPEWVPLGEFARRLGITRGSVYGRIRRGTVQSRPNGNRGFLIAWPPPDHDVAPNGDGNGSADVAGNGVALRIELARLEERLVAADRLLVEREVTILDLRRERDRLAAELVEARRPWWQRWFNQGAGR
jgi:hypothetical protein